jgi:hypothetical protein
MPIFKYHDYCMDVLEVRASKTVYSKNVISNDNIALKSSLMEVFILFKI